MKKIVFAFLILSINLAIRAQNTLAVKSPDEALFNQGIELLQMEKYNAALQSFSEYVARYSYELKSVDAEYYVAFCELAINNPQGEILINNFVEKHPQHPKTVYANYDIGTYYFKNKNYEKAIKHLSKVDLTMLDDANKLESNFKLAYSYMNIKDFDKAAAVFQRIKSTKNKYTYAANYYLGYVNYKNELYDIAEQNLKKASENASYKALVPQVLINVYNKQKRYDTLIVYGERLLSNQEDVKNQEEIYQLLAEAYYQKKDFKKSKEYFDKFSAAGGKMNHAAIYRFGFSLYKADEYLQSVEQFKKIAEQNDTTGQFASYYLGMAYLKLDNKAFAFSAFHQSRKMLFVRYVTAQSTIEYGKLGLELQKYTEVIEAMKEFLKRFPESEETITANGLLSEAYLNTNDYVSAIKHIESVKAKTSVMNKAYQQVTFYHGLELFNDENYEEAATLFEKSLQNDVDRDLTYISHFWLGECNSAQRKYDVAILNYQKILKNTHRVGSEIAAKNYYGLGYAYYNRQEYAKALPNFKDFLNESRYSFNKPTVCDATLRLADCLYATKKYADASQYYNKVIDFQCAELDYPYLQKGIALALSGKDEDAKATLRKVSASSGYYYDATYNIALIDFENTKYEASIPAFTKIISDKKSNLYIPLALQKRAIAYNNLKQYDKSAQDYKTILDNYPTSRLAGNAVIGMQEALSHQGKTDEMDAIIQSYKNINPNDSKIEKLEFDKAKELYFNQKYAESKVKFTKFRDEYPNSTLITEAKFYLADASLRDKDTTEAELIFEELTTERNNNFYAKSAFKLAEINLNTHEYDAAVKNYKKVIESASNNKEISNAWNGLMLSYYELNDHDSSAYYANSILSHGAPSVVFTNRASLYLAKNAIKENKENAADLLVNCINTAQDQHGAEAMYLLGQDLYNNKKYKTSLETLFELNTKFINYEKWTGKSFLLIADNYIAMNELYQAKATLASIIEKASDPQLIELAKEKLGGIENQ